MQLPLVAHVVEHHDRADYDAVAVLDRRGRVLDRNRGAVAAREHHVVRELYDTAFGEAAQHWVLYDGAGGFVGQPDDVADRQSFGVAPLPSRELLRDRVQVFDVPDLVGGYDRVADRLQRNLGPLLLVEQRALGGLALRDVRDGALVVELSAMRVR